MQYRQIIKEAWTFAQANKSLVKWYGIIPSVLSTLAGVLFLAYQFYSFKTTITPSGQAIPVTHDIFFKSLNFLKDNPNYTWYILGFTILISLIYLFYPTFAQGAVIQLIAKKRQGQPVSLIQGITYGLGSFLPMFEYHLVIKTFSFTAIVAETTFILRNLGTDVLYLFLPIFALIALVGLFLTLFFTFVEWFIALEDTTVFSAMKKSSSLVFRNWQHTILILVLLLLIGVRIVLNIILVFFVPLLVFGVIGLFASVAFQNIIFIIGGLATLCALYIAGYLGGTLTIFTYGVWTIVFQALVSPTGIEPVSKA